MPGHTALGWAQARRMFLRATRAAFDADAPEEDPGNVGGVEPDDGAQHPRYGNPVKLFCDVRQGR
eukprot:1378201-Lingulodinium_polyedra.AAC.1